MMWSVLRTIASITLFAAVAVVINHVRSQPHGTTESVLVFTGLFISTGWMFVEIGGLWERIYEPEEVKK